MGPPVYGIGSDPKLRTTFFSRGPVRLFLAALCAMPALADEWRYADVERIVAVSDVHGAYAPLERTLLQAGVLNAGLEWAAGAAHLVINGDLLDGGPDSRSVIDFIMRLEGEASQAGGRVHVVLGDHEVMNLVGDLRYVSTEEYAAYIGDESPEVRARWFQRYKAQQREFDDETAIRAKFDARYPPGFFAHRSAFETDGKYGSWLLEKLLLVVINDIVFVHGGLSPRVAEIGPDGINGEMKNEIIEYVRALNVLVHAGLLDPVENFAEHAAVLQALAPDGDRSPEIRAAIDAIIEFKDLGIFAADSPLLYRGNVGCSTLIESDRLDAALGYVGAERLVAGHSPTVGRKVMTSFGGRLIEIDTGMLHATYEGRGYALKIDGESRLVVGERGPGPFRPTEYVRRVEVGEKSMRIDAVERLLGNGEIAVGEVLPGGRARVTVSGPEGTVNALFQPKSRARQYVPELAAYRLDRYLELDMVPMTVARALNGRAGTLQFRPAASNLEVEGFKNRLPSFSNCPLQDQQNAVHIFDALIDDADDEGSFRTSNTRRAQPAKVSFTIGPVWKAKLAGLDDSKIDELFDDVLDTRRRRALRQRRDALLELALSGK